MILPRHSSRYWYEPIRAGLGFHNRIKRSVISPWLQKCVKICPYDVVVTYLFCSEDTSVRFWVGAPLFINAMLKFIYKIFCVSGRKVESVGANPMALMNEMKQSLSISGQIGRELGTDIK